jgi:hypothetical protein
MEQQLSLDIGAARHRGEVGIARAVDRAERKHSGWVDLALEKFLAHVKTLPHDHEFIAEDIRLVIAGSLPQVPELRVWGAVTRRAIKRLYIIKTGRVAPACSSHGSDKPLYRRGSAV